MPGTVGGFLKATQAFVTSFQKGLDVRGLQLNLTKCEYIPARPLPPSALPQDGRFDTTNGSLFWAPLSVRLLPPQPARKAGRRREARDPTRPPPVASHPRLVPEQPPCPHDAPRASTCGAQQMQTSLKTYLGGITQVPTTQGAWLRAQGSFGKGGFGETLFSTLQQPSKPQAAARPPSATASCLNFTTLTTPTWPLLTASGSTLRGERTARNATRAICHAQTLGSLMEGDREIRSPSNCLRSPELELGWLEEPTHLSLTGTPISTVPSCKIAFEFPSSTRTHSAPCTASQSLV